MPLPESFMEANGWVVGYDNENDQWIAEIHGKEERGGALEIAQALFRAEDWSITDPDEVPWLHESDDGVRVCDACLRGMLLDRYMLHLYGRKKMPLYAIYKFLLENVCDERWLVSQTFLHISPILGKEALTQLPGTNIVGIDKEGWIVIQDGVRVKGMEEYDLAELVYADTPGFDEKLEEADNGTRPWLTDGARDEEALRSFFMDEYITLQMSLCQEDPDVIVDTLTEFGIDESVATNAVMNAIMGTLFDSLSF